VLILPSTAISREAKMTAFHVGTISKVLGIAV
jgi:hypothetical protein